MTRSDLEHFREILTGRRDLLSEYLNSPGTLRSIETEKIRGLLVDIRQALSRVEDQTFGTCRVCKGEVEYDRLEVQPVRQVCLDCITPEEQAMLEEELAVAGKIHRALLPQRSPVIEGFELAVKSFAAGTVGGDYYDFLTREDDPVVKVVIADTMGKGIPAGLLMSNLQGALRVLADEHDSPGRLLERLNWWLCRNVPINKFISLACVNINPGPGTSPARYANAGHCAPIVVRDDGRCDLLDSTGGVLGVHEGFEYGEQMVHLNPGDTLLFYTDGVTEAGDAAGELFGEDQLVAVAGASRAESAEALVGKILREVGRFTGKAVFDDDLTIIAIKKK